MVKIKLCFVCVFCAYFVSYYKLFEQCSFMTCCTNERSCNELWRCNTVVMLGDNVESQVLPHTHRGLLKSWQTFVD